MWLIKKQIKLSKEFSLGHNIMTLLSISLLNFENEINLIDQVKLTIYDKKAISQMGQFLNSSM